MKKVFYGNLASWWKNIGLWCFAFKFPCQSQRIKPLRHDLIDFSHSEISPEEAEKIFENQKFVKSVKLLSPIADRFVGDTYYFPLMVMDERVLIFRKEIYEGISRA